MPEKSSSACNKTEAPTVFRCENVVPGGVRPKFPQMGKVAVARLRVLCINGVLSHAEDFRAGRWGRPAGHKLEQET